MLRALVDLAIDVVKREGTRSFEFEFSRHFIEKFLVGAAAEVGHARFVLEDAFAGMAYHVGLAL
jgi:uncharacterized Zn finger protein